MSPVCVAFLLRRLYIYIFTLGSILIQLFLGGEFCFSMSSECLLRFDFEPTLQTAMSFTVCCFYLNDVLPCVVFRCLWAPSYSSRRAVCNWAGCRSVFIQRRSNKIELTAFWCLRHWNDSVFYYICWSREHFRDCSWLKGIPTVKPWNVFLRFVPSFCFLSRSFIVVTVVLIKS